MSEPFYKNWNIEEQMAFWNAKAKPCSHYERRSEYADEFLRLSGIIAGESVFDMGCGSGTLCLPLADDGHRVFCADFSDNMLQSVRNTIQKEDISSIRLYKLCWQDDWTAHDLPVCDLAFASRCMFGIDPEESVKKLSEHAKRRVCITLPVNAAMFHGSDSPYDLGSRDDMNDFAARCMDAVRKLGYTPQPVYMNSGSSGESRWLFISWDKNVKEAHI